MSTRNDNSGHVPEIDALRAIAVLSVMLYHLEPTWIRGGYAGVDVFFVISGYVVSASLHRDLKLSLLPFLLAFYARRAVRILPALLAMLLPVSLVTVMVVPELWLNTTIRDTGVTAAFALSNWYLSRTSDDAYFAPAAEFNPFLHTWSLGVEEQFYVLFPLALYLCARLDRLRPHGPWVGASVLGALSALSLVWAVAAQDTRPTAAFYLLPGRFWELGVGALLFQCQRSGMAIELSPRLRTGLLVAALATIAFGLGFTTRTGFPIPWALAPVLGTFVAIAVVTSGPAYMSAVRRWLRARPLVLVGLLSYSLYLWHWPVFVLMRWTVGLEGLAQRSLALALTVALSMASYWLLERPLRTSALVRAVPRGAVVAGGLLLVACTYLMLDQVHGAIRSLSLSVVTRDATDWKPLAWNPPPGTHVRCGLLTSGSGDAPRVEYRPSLCFDRGLGADLYVVGDSHAASYKTMLTRLVREQGIQVTVYQRAGCGFLNLVAPAPAQCDEFLANASADIRRRARPGDVVLLASMRVQRLGLAWSGIPPDRARESMLGQEAARKRVAAAAEIPLLLPPLLASGARVVFVAPTPLFRAPPFRCSDGFNAGNPICAPGFDMERETLEEYRSPTLAALHAVRLAHPEVEVWDPFPILCPDRICSAYRSGKPLFNDGDHLSGYGNEVLYADLLRLLQAPDARR